MAYYVMNADAEVIGTYGRLADAQDSARACAMECEDVTNCYTVELRDEYENYISEHGTAYPDGFTAKKYGEELTWSRLP